MKKVIFFLVICTIIISCIACKSRQNHSAKKAVKKDSTSQKTDAKQEDFIFEGRKIYIETPPVMRKTTDLKEVK